MNSSSKTLVAAALIAIFGGAALMFAQAEVTTKQEVVKLERVVIIGKRASAGTQVARHVEQLPRVVIEGRRAPAADGTQLARACSEPVLC